MKKFLILFFVSAVVITAVAYISNTQYKGIINKSIDNISTNVLLEQEARMVDHFCLSRIPPVIGDAARVKTWENALKSEIFLRESAGEVIALIPDMEHLSSKINNLKTGESISTVSIDESGKKSQEIVFRPENASNQYLIIRKTGGIKRNTGLLPTPNLWFAILLGLIGGLVTAGLGQAITKK